MKLPHFDPALSELMLYGLFISFAAVCIIQLLYFWIIYSRFAFYRRKKVNTERQPVTVVICARDEYQHLKKNLPSILEQEYPEFEVLVVNDSSDDDTEFLLKTLSDRYPHLSVVHFRKNLNFFSGKKFPLALGIRSAKYNHILLTEADCRPDSPFWLREMQSAFLEGKQLVLGYSRYELRKGLLNKLMRFDSAFQAMKYFSWALAGMPYTGVGKNLSYTKELFFKSGGFISHYRIRFGDDDLFVNRNAKASFTAISPGHEAHTVSVTRYTFSRWIKKKKRQLATTRHYRPRHLFVLALFSLTQLLFYVLAAILLAFTYNFYIVAALFSLRMISALIIFKSTMNRLKERNLLLLLPLLEVFLLILNPLLSFTASIVKQDKWK